MKQKLMAAIEILFESLYFLILTYTLSSMAASFNPDLFGLLCLDCRNIRQASRHPNRYAD